MLNLVEFVTRELAFSTNVNKAITNGLFTFFSLMRNNMHVEKTYLKASFIFFQIKSLFNNLYMLLEWLHFCSPLYFVVV